MFIQLLRSSLVAFWRHIHVF